jgi:hypothetical protein
MPLPQKFDPTKRGTTVVLVAVFIGAFTILFAAPLLFLLTYMS